MRGQSEAALYGTVRAKKVVTISQTFAQFVNVYTIRIFHETNTKQFQTFVEVQARSQGVW